MLVQVYIAKLGTASVAANAVSNSIFSVLYAAPSAVATLAVTIVGQCIGAGEKKLARRYGRSMVWLCTVLVLLSLAIGMPCIPLQNIDKYKASHKMQDIDQNRQVQTFFRLSQSTEYCKSTHVDR